MTMTGSGESRALPLLLVVEEDDGVRNLLRAALTAQGFEVLIAPNGVDALEQYRQHGDQIRIVLMDVNMHGLSGLETLVRMQRINESVRCCFMTGDTSAQRWPELLSAGALAIVSKPFPSLSELGRTLRQYLS